MRIRPGLTALLLVIPALGHATVQTSTSAWSDQAPPPRSEPALRAAMLSQHNAVRTQFGAPPLAWNEELALRAKRYAEAIARTRNFSHDPQSGVRPRDGENLFMGTRGAYRYEEMVGLWIDERVHFVRGTFPAVSRTGDWTRVGHYTQMVWPGTREMGCAVAGNGTDDVLVCRYFPAGNVMGFPLGVTIAAR
jgi:Cysteine-rich secretory protein family